MTPRLLLLTGPAAGDVAAVLRAATPAADPRQGASCDPWWDEVRDYWEAPRCIAGVPDAVAIEHGIRDCPGGEEWLVGLVLPAHRFCCFGGGQEYCAYRNAEPLAKHWRCEYCRRKGDLPARLAILAPDPPPLLVERVRAWGGEVWWCERTGISRNEPTGLCNVTLYHESISRALAEESTWPEAVRAALEECCLDHRCCVDSPDCDCAPWCVLCDNPVPHGHYCADTGALVYSAWPMEIAPSMPSSHTVVAEKNG